MNGGARTEVAIIVAMTPKRVIGRNNDLPWRLSADLKRFKALTMGHHMLMGRRTWESIGRALPGRTTIVLSHQPQLSLPEGVHHAQTLEQARDIANAAGDDTLWICGGAGVYAASFAAASRLELTVVEADVEGDAWFPELDLERWTLQSQEAHAADDRNQHAFEFRSYRREKSASSSAST